MIDYLLFAGAALASFLFARRSLALGVCSVITVGYFYGVVRANVLSPMTTFMFDAALLGLYVGALEQRVFQRRSWQTPTGRWMLALILWPAFMALVPINHLLIQAVAFRSSVWFLLILFIGVEMRWADVKVVGRWLAVLNLVALGFGIYVYVYGVPVLYPLNDVTAFTYRSRDVADGQWRIPSTFLFAHAYGGTMLMSIPFLAAIAVPRSSDAEFDGGSARRLYDRPMGIVGFLAAVAGVLLCGARQPVVMGLVAGVIALAVVRFNFRTFAATLAVVGLATFAASQNDRLQRSLTLLDTDFLTERIGSSVNEGVLDLIVTYPLGGGMGSAFGTSIPFFLAQYAPAEIIGAENEFSRIQVNQGVFGLLIWVGFLVWSLAVPPPQSVKGRRVPLGLNLAYAFCVTVWTTAWIGAGTTAAVPAAAMLFLLMGVVLRTTRPARRAVQPGLRPVGLPPQLRLRGGVRAR